MLILFHNGNGQQNSPYVEFWWEKIEGNLRWSYLAVTASQIQHHLLSTLLGFHTTGTRISGQCDLFSGPRFLAFRLLNSKQKESQGLGGLTNMLMPNGSSYVCNRTNISSLTVCLNCTCARLMTMASPLLSLVGLHDRCLTVIDK